MPLARLNENQLPESLLRAIEDMKNRITQLEKQVSELKTKHKEKDKK